MPDPRQTPRSLAVSAVVATALLVPAIGCSSAELASGGFDQGEAGMTGDNDDDSPSNQTGDSESDSGTEDEGETDEPPESPEDPGVDLSQCQPDVAQLLAYDLAESQAELAPALVRESVLDGLGAVPNIPLGARPFLNHFDFAYPPADSSMLEISSELWKPPMANIDAPTRYRLQYAIRAPQMLAEQRVPVDLAIVVDLGPNMAGDPLVLAEEALAAVEAALVPGDRVTLIGAGYEPIVLADGVVIENLGLSPLTGLLGEQPPAPSGKVGLALELAYTTIAPSWDGQGQPRVLLISNGHFQLDDAIVELVDDQAADGRYLMTVGVGEPDMIADASLRALAHEGRGPLLYDRNAEQLWADLHERFTRHMIAVATELEITLVLPPGLAIRDRDQLPGGETEAELGLLGANDLLVFHHELESCGELDPSAEIQIECEWNDPLSGEALQVVWSQPIVEPPAEGSLAGRKGAAAVAYVRALRGYRDGTSGTAGFGAVLDAASAIADALAGLPDDPDLVEMSQVLGKLEG